ncbi:type I restriction endonuclease subunit R [Schumannella luteola]|uniref:Type I restriction enzyme endonuclease subunit n=1 Tax=Schumannella luteola TaxID=472059 RepID=A0A852YAF2_9MICO|nr:type I restriction endonuclease subunit R [Schumannella luteola]NYG98340.1 type I restriction enzyme R subunit [Schumannella luteola]TPX05763.1 type I restriction endonuclease subunit R [Schumannella luteola]
MPKMSEADWEQLAIDELAELGWTPTTGEKIAPGSGGRDSWGDLVIRPRLLEALQRLNPTIPAQYLKQAMAEMLAPASADAIAENLRVHRMYVDGFPISYFDGDGIEHNPTVRILSTQPHENSWLAVQQVTVTQGEHKRRFDVVLYVNGLPMVVIELKAAGAKAGTVDARAQLDTYLREFPLQFRHCVFVIATDGQQALYGTPFTPYNHFSPWNVDDDGVPVGADAVDEHGEPISGLETTLDGVANQERFLQLVRSFTAFDGGDKLLKRIAKPHQYFAVTKAVARTIDAARTNGKAGVVWHTQGSGKSMEMELYANLVGRRAELQNPTLVVVTDRTELDGQLFQGFDRSLLLGEHPVRIDRRQQLRDELTSRVTGGIYFTTLQKFGLSKAEKDAGTAHPLLSDRRNVIVVVDEAHRSHYDDLDGYARHLRDALPNATLIAFTGTPISFDERNTQDVFGDYIDIYDLTRAVDDGATVPVYFEPRLITVARADGVSDDDIDVAADEATQGLDETERARLEQSVAVINAVYGAPDRIAKLAAELVTHWESRRLAMLPDIEVPGKALIVGGTREICARLYAAIVELRPDWHSDAIDQGRIKVVYSGLPSDPAPIVDHVRRPSENETIKNRLRDPDDELEIVIVKDMMLTGFDAPPLHTLYLDRPLKGALLMQTLARVNRTFRGKQDGLLVAYAPLADNLGKALAEYTVTDQERKPIGRDIAEMTDAARSVLADVETLVAGYDWRGKLAAGGPRAMFNAVSGTVNHLRDAQSPANDPALGDETRAARYRILAGKLARAWALASSALEELRPQISFYEEVRIWMAKYDAQERQARGLPVPDDIARLLGDLIAANTITGEVVDIYAAAGMPAPSLGDLTPEFVKRTQQSDNPQLAIEALRDLLLDETRTATRGNGIRERAFSERIAELMYKYTNQQLTAAEVIAELVALARDVAEEARRGEKFSPALSDDELAFYDAVAQNESAVLEQGDDVLAQIARDLVGVMRRDVRTDWTVREDVRAKLRSSIKRLLVLHGYPPDQQPEAIVLVMEQMEALAPKYAVS